MTAEVEIERPGGIVLLTVVGEIEWSGRGRFARVHNVEIESATCTCGHEVKLSYEEEQKCIDALTEQAEQEHGDAMIDMEECA